MASHTGSAHDRGVLLLRRATILTATIISVLILFVGTATASTIGLTCEQTLHCYASRTQGLPADLIGPGTLGNVSSVTARVRTHCQVLANYSTNVATSEFWVGTPMHSGNPGMREWVETGLTSGTFNGSPSQNIFFWARGYWVSASSMFVYEEFRIGTALASIDTDYEHRIYYVPGSGSGTGWRVSSPAGNGGGSANRPPGSYQWVQMGGETSVPADGNVGAVSNEYRVSNGTTVYGLTGHIFYSTDGYTFTTTSSRNISFRTPFANATSCR
jgi:hypothetical protein